MQGYLKYDKRGGRDIHRNMEPLSMHNAYYCILQVLDMEKYSDMV